MTDTTLNRFHSRGTAAQRAAFTPSLPTPASGPSMGYLWFEEDTGRLYAWNNTGTPGWQLVTATAAAGGDCALLASATPSGTGTVTFSTISGAYSHLLLKVFGASTASATFANVLLRFNGDTGANYDQSIAKFNGTSSLSNSAANTSIKVFDFPAATAAANAGGSGTVEIPGYAINNAALQKSCVSLGAWKNSTSDMSIFCDGGWWRSGVPITQIDVILSSGNWVAGSKLSLYGMT